MAKTPKLLILFFLMLLTLSISVSAITITDTGNNIDATGLNTYNGNFYNPSPADEDGNHFMYAQAGGTGIDHNFYYLDSNFNNITSKRSLTFFTGNLVSGNFASFGTNGYFGNSENGVTYYIDILDNTLTKTDTYTLPYKYPGMFINFDNNNMYISNNLNMIDKYTSNGILVTRYNITTINPSLPTTGLRSINWLKEDIFILIYGNDVSYEVYNGFSEIISNVTFTSGTEVLTIYKTISSDNYTFLNGTSHTSASSSYDLVTLSDVATFPTFTVGGITYSKTQLCTDEGNICDNAFYILDEQGNVELTCADVESKTLCTNGCTNSDVNGIEVGTCEQIACTMECNTLGEQICLSPTTYGICGNYDSDPCYEYGIPVFCPANYYCSDDEEVGSSCYQPTENAYYNQNYLNVNLELDSQTGIVKEEGTSEAVKYVSDSVTDSLATFIAPGITFIPFYKQIKTYVLEAFYKDEINETYVHSGFDSVSGDSVDFMAYNCDYQEEPTFNDRLTHNDLNANGWVGSGVINTTETYNFIETTGTISKTITPKTNAIIETIIELEETGTYNIKFYSGTNLQLNYEIVTNKTSFNTYIKELESGETLFNITSSSDDLQEIFLSTVFDSDSSTAHSRISLIREVIGVDINEYYFSLPMLSGSLNTDKVTYESNTNELWIYQISGISVNEYPIFKKINNTQKSFQCTHDELECYNVRVYSNEQGMSTYHFYEDVKTCISSLNGGITSTDDLIDGGVVTSDERSTIEKALNKNWNTKQKLLFAVITLIIVFGLFGALTMADGDKTFMLIGTILTGVLMFYFIIDGFIPAWVIVLFGIVGAFISASAIRNMSTGA